MSAIPSPHAGHMLSVGFDSTNVRGRKRIYQVWKGSNKFCCGGRLIFGPDVRSLFITLVLIIAPMVVFCVFVGRHLMNDFGNESGVAIMVIAIVHTLAVLSFLILTSARDPGIIPRNSHPPEPDDELSSSSDWSEGQTPKQRLPRTKDVIVNGISVKVKYCDTCMLYRPPRCSHCSICNNCVQRFDHHCPWVGQCIGQRNYPSFFLFVSSATLLCLFVLSMCALRIKKLMDGDQPHNVLKAMQRSPASVFLMAYTFLAMWFVGGLTVFHLYLIGTNQTTYENFRNRYDNRANAYDQGFLFNFKDVLCSSIPTSKVNFRAKVQIETPGHGNFTPKKRENMDMHRLNSAKVLNKMEARGTSAWTAMPGSQETYRPVNAGGIKKEMKPWYESAFREEHGNFRNPVEIRPQQNSQGHQGSNRRMPPEIFGVPSAIGGLNTSKVAYPTASYK